MRIGFVVNDIKTEKPVYSTNHMAFTATKMGHSVYIIGVGDLAYTPNGNMGAHAYCVPDKKFKSAETFLEALQKSKPTYLESTDLDVLFLRNDPAEDMIDRPWAQNAGINFGQIAMEQGVIVLNDPGSLSTAMNKMYFQHFPEILRPKTVITRDQKEIMNFFEEQKKHVVLKPLQGSGGKNVFLVDNSNVSNLNQIIEAISRDGYVIAQEYLPAAKEGDIRLFVMNGRALTVNGKYAAFRRVSTTEDIRSNMHVGGKAKRAKVDDTILNLVEVLRPKLVQDGMFLVGIDIVGDKLMEINVFSPGGLNNVGLLEGEDFIKEVIKAIEKKVYYKQIYGDKIDNRRISTL